MEVLDGNYWNRELSKPTTVLGIKRWVLIVVCAALAALIIVSLACFCYSCRRKRRRRPKPRTMTLKQLAAEPSPTPSPTGLTPAVSKEIQEVARHNGVAAAAAAVAPHPVAPAEIQIDIGKPDHRVVFGGPGQQRKPQQQQSLSSAGTSGEDSHRSGSEAAAAVGLGNAAVGGGVKGPEVSHLGWGHWYTLRELEEATAGFAPENMIGEGGYGIVYRGVFTDGTKVAVKNLLNNRGQAEKEFKVEVEAIGRVRHKNLVRLLGYCVEGAHRMLVYEYVDNGNLDQWLHGDVGPVSPLTWEIRMNIILGTAKGLAYLHEGLEPKVVHRDVKSSNILLDRQWHPKVSDFGLAKLLRSETNHVTTRVMGTFGYVAPEYASTGMLNERSDVYSFGVLIMELITGRMPVDFARPEEQVHLVEWLKNMVGDRRSEEVLDPKIPERPSPKALKRALLVALRCVDPDSRKRPKMGHVIHMFETDDLLRDDRKLVREAPISPHDYSKRTVRKQDSSISPRDVPDEANWR